jgi:cell division protein FtsN
MNQRSFSHAVRRGAALIWLLLILIAGVAIVGYNIYQSKQQKDKIAHQEKLKKEQALAQKKAEEKARIERELLEKARKAKEDKERKEREKQEELDRERKEREEEEAARKKALEEERREREEEEAKEKAKQEEERARKEHEAMMQKKFPFAAKYEKFPIHSLTRTPEQIAQLLSYIDKVSLKANAPFTGKSFTGRDWATPKDVLKKLPDRLLFKVKNPKNQDLNVLLLLNSPQARLDIAQWIFLKNADSQLFKKLASDPKHGSIVSQFMNNLNWIESFVYAGANQKTAQGLDFLVNLVAHDPQIPTNPMKRKIATAIAAEFGRAECYDKEGSDPYSMAKVRYDYFSSSWQEGELNATFDQLQDWDMRIVCGTRPQNSGFGSATTLRWLRENCTLQEGSYPMAACQVPYRLENIFGDSIHGQDYYKPFESIYPENYSKQTRDIGSVCGGNATFGTSSACANGIAALTMGEPGHCAFAIRVNNKWQRCFSIDWKHSCHWTVWGETQWSFLELTQDFFQEGYRANLSMQIAALGEMMAETDNAAKAPYFFELATDIQPLNYAAWTSYANFLKKAFPDDVDKWKKLNEGICLGIAGKHPEVCAVTLTKYVYPRLLALLKDEKDKITAFESYMKNLKQPESDKWPLDEFLKQQADSLSASDPAVVAYFKTLFEHLLNKPAYAAQTLAWAQEYEKSLNDDTRNKVAELAMSSVGNTTMDKADKDKLQAAALIGAENSRDIDTFQSISKQYKDRITGSLPEFQPFSGELLSSGGLVRFSSVSQQYGDPLQHGGIIETSGGNFHTDNKNEEEWAEVIMPKPGTLSGIVIATTGNNHDRLHDWKVETSMDGNSWTPAATLPSPVKESVIRVDLKGKNTIARHIRVVRGGKKDFFSLRAILVYGQKAA